jgi:hypothetical protein
VVPGCTRILVRPCWRCIVPRWMGDSGQLLASRCRNPGSEFGRPPYRIRRITAHGEHRLARAPDSRSRSRLTTGVERMIKVVVVTLLCTALAVLFSRAALCNLRYAWQHRGRPLIEASDSDLWSQQSVWPLRSERWPEPSDDRGRTMSRIRCDAYARLATSTASAWRAISTVVLLLGSAWLGVRLLRFIDDLERHQPHRAVDDSVQASVADVVSAYTDRNWWLSTAPLLLITIGLLLEVVVVTEYSSAARAYETAASSTTSAAEEQSDPPGVSRNFGWSMGIAACAVGALWFLAKLTRRSGQRQRPRP